MYCWQGLVKKRKRTKLGKDTRRKHRHWQVTVYRHEGEKFGRVYTDRVKAATFAERSKKPPLASAKDLRFMKLALKEAQLSAERQRGDRSCPPAVGVVVVGPDGKLLATAHRSEGKWYDDHAEFIALQRKLKGKKALGAILYTTLEPCMDVRSEEKVDCAIWVAKSGASEVVIGMMDPNDRVCAKGWLHLHSCGIRLRRFPEQLELEIRNLNRSFIEHVIVQKRQNTLPPLSHASPMRKRKRRPVLRFVNDLRPDKVDVRAFLKRFQERAVVPVIQWPHVNDALWYRALDERSRIIERYRLSEARGGDPAQAERDFEWLDRVIDFSWRVRNEAAARIPKMWRGMKLLWPRSNPLNGKDPYIMALVHYLTLCNFELLSRLRKVQRAALGDLFPRGHIWSELEDHPAEVYRDVFGYRPRFGSADITIVESHDIELTVFAAFEEMRRIWVKSGYGRHPIKGAFREYAEFIIPQSEVKLIGKPWVLTYWNMAWKQVRDEQGRNVDKWWENERELERD